jgi:hypothetical protein
VFPHDPAEFLVEAGRGALAFVAEQLFGDALDVFFGLLERS